MKYNDRVIAAFVTNGVRGRGKKKEKSTSDDIVAVEIYGFGDLRLFKIDNKQSERRVVGA